MLKACAMSPVEIFAEAVGAMVLLKKRTEMKNVHARVVDNGISVYLAVASTKRDSK